MSGPLSSLSICPPAPPQSTGFGEDPKTISEARGKGQAEELGSGLSAAREMTLTRGEPTVLSQD